MNKISKELWEQVRDTSERRHYSVDMYAQMMHQYAYEDDAKHWWWDAERGIATDRYSGKDRVGTARTGSPDSPWEQQETRKAGWNRKGTSPYSEAEITEPVTVIIVDTSIWVTHLREGNPRLEELLLEAQVVSHPFIIGELACGNIKNRDEFLTLLRTLPTAPTVDLDELLYFIEKKRLMGLGIGFEDVHLLASAELSGAPLWTSDKKLKSAAIKLKLAYGWEEHSNRL